MNYLTNEHNFFVAEVEKFGTQKSFKHTLYEVEAKMIDEGLISRPILTGGAKIVQLWNKYKRVACLAAGIAGIVSVLTIGLASIFNKTTKCSIIELTQSVSNNLETDFILVTKNYLIYPVHESDFLSNRFLLKKTFLSVVFKFLSSSISSKFIKNYYLV